MRRVNPATVAAITLIFAISSAGAGLVVKLNGTWTAGWHAAAGCFGFCLLVLARKLLPESSPWFRWSGPAHRSL
jgi:hypothetical protein